jgi:hypothetical protein
MIIIQWKPSPEHQKAFEAGLRHLVQLGRVPAGLNVDPHPQPVYVLKLEDKDLRSPEAAKLVSWRYFASRAPGEVVVGEVRATPPPAVISLLYGNSAQNTLKATLALEQLRQVREKDYHLQLLRIPEALIEGFWLKPPSDGNGLIVTRGRSFEREKQSGRPYNIDEFLKTLRPVEKQVFRSKEDLPLA